MDDPAGARFPELTNVDAYLEVGSRRAFAGALDWPGWCRGGRDQDAALEALIAYGPRYAAVLGPGFGFVAPKAASAFDVVERLTGDATTDFGAPGIVPAFDARPVDDEGFERLAALLRASWAALYSAADAAVGVELRKGPRGGGRELDAIVRHVTDADTGYLRHVGGRYRSGEGADLFAEARGVRETVLETLRSRHRGEPLAEGRTPPRSPWTPSYYVRRSAWHALDHAWEIEDRASKP